MKRLNLWLFIFLSLGLLQAKAQTDSVYFTKEIFQSKLEELKTKHGLYKTIPAEYELAALVALSYYPELDSIPIEIVCLPLHTTMAAQPRTRTFFAGKCNRRYAVFINTSKENTGFLPTELSFNQLVGVLGHELGHVSYYCRQPASQLLVDAFGYYFRNYRKSFENATDLITVEHGLGWQLLDFTDFVANKAHLSKSYARKKKITYMSEKELYSILKSGQIKNK